MEYDCQLLLASKLQVGFNKVATPLCTHCQNRGCTNPIVDKKVSVFGKIMSTRLYEAGGSSFMVVACEGYQAPLFDDGEDGEYEVEDDEV